MAKKSQTEVHEIFKRTGRQDTRMVQAIENQNEMITALKGVITSLQEIQKPTAPVTAKQTEDTETQVINDENKKDEGDGVSSAKQPPKEPVGTTPNSNTASTDVKQPPESSRSLTLGPETKKLLITDSVLRNINELVLDPQGSTEVKAFGGATIEEMESIIRNGPDLSDLDSITIHIGINNTGIQGYTDYKPALGKLARTVKSKAGPFASVTFTSALPCESRSLQVATLNDSIEAMCDEECFSYLELTRKFESAPGVVNQNLFFDKLHPNTEGDRLLIMTLRDWTSTKRPQYVEHSLQDTTFAAGNTLHLQGNVFQSSATPVRDRHDIWNAVQRHKAKRGMHTARHHMYAYRIRKSGKIIEHFDDDVEPGGGKAILDRMRAKGIINAVCIVSRWTGEHLGPRRFDVFASCAMEAWNKYMICSIPLMKPSMENQYQSQYSSSMPVWLGGLQRTAYPFTNLNKDVRQHGFKFSVQ